MKKILCILFSMLLLLQACALAELDEEELLLEEIVEGEEGYDLPPEVTEAPAGPAEAAWGFPVALEDMKPEFVILANKHYLLDKSFVCKPLKKIKSMKLAKDKVTKKSGDMYVLSKGMELNETCADALIALADAAREDGYNLYLKSAYRSWQTQNTMYYNRLKKNKGKDDGWVSKPGASDHQTGLGCDVVPKSWKSKSMNSKMAREPECQWMAQHCQEYGFIIRYPEEKQAVTEINYEPWHLRYVGVPAATFIMDNGLCLEEFNEELQLAIREYLEAGGDRSKVEAFIQNPSEE